MQKRVKQTKQKAPKRVRQDVNQWARDLVDRTTAEPEPLIAQPKGLSAYMSALGRKGGQVSGARRMTNLSDEQRREIASKAARAMWAKRRKKA